MEVQALQMTPVAMHATSHLGETIEKEPQKSFGTYLQDALSEVNQLQLASDKQNALLAAGEVQDVSQVIVAGQKAEIALQLTLQLRNRAVAAYQEIMRMQV
ncbi:flagellar hook-basal body complex protein FliE [Selenomonas sp. oral taxon 126]|uniref:flagellar hook-basal body complex protein FliE n=1 Tax=Selenomonas sp. oral taxon 126 TaxID=712528 RepID=UPI0008077531|nr:flagellar hook-basal body complex protein FliE [Selenomonas sp. oral taxon 126]ANR70801.1 flagellar hook-basal body complex protein FliE [Selenomonas sp. oral taxon 126]